MRRRFNKSISFIIFSFLVTLVSSGFSSWSIYVGNSVKEKDRTVSTTTKEPVAYYTAKVSDVTTSYYFDSIEKAVEHANDTSKTNNIAVEVKARITSEKKITIKKGFIIGSMVTLTIPYSNDEVDSSTLYKVVDTYSENKTNEWDTSAFDSVNITVNSIDTANGNSNGDQTNVYKVCTSDALSGKKKQSHMTLEVIVNSGVTITNNGTIRIGGVQSGANGGSIAGFVCNSFAQVTLKGKASIVSYGRLINFGYIVGEKDISNNVPTIFFDSGSITYIPFVLVEHRGGSCFAVLYKKYNLAGTPFNRYYFPSFIATNITFKYGTTLKGVPDLYANSQHNRSIVEVISSSSGLIKPSSGWYLESYFEFKTHEGDEKEMPCHTLVMNGNWNLQALSLAIEKPIQCNLSTEDVFYPLSGYYDITLQKLNTQEKAIVTSSKQKCKVLPGGSLTICENVEVSIPGIIVYNTDLALSSNLKGYAGSIDYETTRPGVVKLGGKLTTNSFGGKIDAISASANLVVNTATSGIESHEVHPTNTATYSLAIFGFGEDITGGTYYVISFDGYFKYYNKSNYERFNPGTHNAYKDENSDYTFIGEKGKYKLQYYHSEKDNDIDFEEKNITNTNEAYIIETTSFLAPAYAQNKYEFSGFYLDSNHTISLELAPETYSTAELNGGDYSLLTIPIYCLWEKSTRETINVQIGSLNGETISYSNSPVELGNGEVIEFEANPIKSTVFDDVESKIITADFLGWDVRRIYLDENEETQESLIESIVDKTTSTYAVDDVSELRSGDTLRFEPKYTINTYNYPTVTISTNHEKALGASSSDKTAIITAEITNYYPNVFDYSLNWSCNGQNGAGSSNCSFTKATSFTNQGNNIGKATSTFESKVQHYTSDYTTADVTYTYDITLTVTVSRSGFSGDKSFISNQIFQSLTKYKKASTCLTSDTLITLADGTQTEVRNLQPGDLIRVFNHETGEIDVAPITFNDHDSADWYNVIHLEFSNGEEVKVVSEHGFFDLDTMKYEYIDEFNYVNFIGHRFYTEDGNYVTLDKAYVNKEFVELYSPTSFFHFDYFTEGILSMPGGIAGLFNIFEYSDNLQYDQDKYQQDIETYGLFTYEDLAPLGVTEIMFDAYAGKYLKVALGKGILTMEYLEYLIERYGGFTE